MIITKTFDINTKHILFPPPRPPKPPIPNMEADPGGCDDEPAVDDGDEAEAEAEG